MGDKCGRQVWETSVGDKCKLSPKNPEWETSVGNKSGRQVWETSVGDKWETSTHALPDIQSGRHVWETSGRQV